MYKRHDGDVKFRRVSVFYSNLPNYEPFVSEDQTIQTNSGVCIEVLREDGTTSVVYPGEDRTTSVYPGEDRTTVYYNADLKNFYLPSSIPPQHLWVRRCDGSGMAYKVPSELPVDAGRTCFTVPGGTAQVELFGDKYFEAVYELRKA